MVVVGMKNCSKCEALKKKLDSENKEYTYYDFREVSLAAQRKISKNFRTPDGAIDFPVVIEDAGEYRL